MSQVDGAKLGATIVSRFVVVDGELPEGADAESPQYLDRIAKIVEVTDNPDGSATKRVIYERG